MSIHDPRPTPRPDPPPPAAEPPGEKSQASLGSTAPAHEGYPPAPHSSYSPVNVPDYGQSAPTRRPAWVLPTITGFVGLVAGVTLVLGVQAALDGSADRSRQAVLTGAVESCGLEGADGITLGDEGTTLTFDMQGEDDFSGADYFDIACVFAGLDMPSSILSHIDQTTSLDGRQSETWNGMTISWSYHPGRGLDGIVSVGGS